MIRRLLKVLALGLLAAITARKKTKSALTPEPPIARKKSNWKRWAFRGAMALAGLGLGGFLVSTSGLISLKASSGHWPITRWFLNFSKERSVATYSIGIKSPGLNVEWRVLKGAGHFEVGCSPCHGSPDGSQPRIPHAMLPPPPALSREVADWDPEELFYIVKHGIKFTGMPAWPADNRDDEVWAVVAFLQKLPGLDGESYKQLTHGETPARNKGVSVQNLLPPEGIREIVSQNCARCHGLDGNGRGIGAFPKLAGQKREYLLSTLEAYASKERHSGMMEPIAAGLKVEAMQHLAEYYSNLKRSAGEPINREGFERGKAIAFAGIPEKGVPACADCHIPASGPKNAMYPNLAGQYPEYIKLQLELFKAGHRGGTSYSHLMRHVAEHLGSGEMDDLATFFSELTEAESQ